MRCAEAMKEQVTGTGLPGGPGSKGRSVQWMTVPLGEEDGSAIKVRGCLLWEANLDPSPS